MKRIASLLLVLVLVASMLCGCGGDGNENVNGEAFSVIYLSDYGIRGEHAAKLITALADVGIAYVEGEYEKTVYVGNDENGLTQRAAEQVNSRENNYNDYSFICDGTNVAIYGGSEYALDNAISSFIDQYVSDGAITVSSDLSYLSQPETRLFTVDGKTLNGMRVVAGDKSYRSIAKRFAKMLSISTGYHLTDSAVAGDNDLTIEANNFKNEEDFSDRYTVSVSNSMLIVTAQTRASLSYAVQDFVASLSEDVELANGTNEEKRFTMKHVDATDTELFKYCGMWEAADKEAPSSMISYWNVAYVEISFTGNAITPEFSKETTFKIKMDKDVSYSDYITASGKVTFFADGDGVHTLRIYTDRRSNHLHFAGVSVEESTVLSRTPDKPHYVQFVGDSISDTQKSFSHRVGDILGWDYSVTAISGIALEDDYGNWRNNHGFNKTTGEYVPNSMAEMLLDNFNISSVGMETAFFKLGVPENSMKGEEREKYGNGYYTKELDCSFDSGNTPDIVFIFLGTNDELFHPSSSKRFKEAYLEFVDNVLKLYGEDTQIIVMQGISSGTSDHNTEIVRYVCVREAANALIEKHPDNVTFIDRDVLSAWNVEISGDNIHPSEKGYDTLTTKIADFLKETFK